MQRLLCAKDREIELLREENTEAKAAVKKADGVVADALRRERNLEVEMERLRAEAYEMPSLKTQLEEAQASIARLQAEMELQFTQSVEKDKQIETLVEGKLKAAQELTRATGKLWEERQTRRYLMTSGIEEILMKVRTSDEYGKFVGGLVPKIQALERSDLIKKMRHDYFPNVRPEEIPYFVPNAEVEAEAAFQQLRTAPFECQILARLAANPDMTEEEIRNLQNPELVAKTGAGSRD